ncbi:hypothetical protein GGI25_004376 [Coemansia spiralis]|uniref:MTOR-associated protein MEAK7 n=2 Tax=Coemansia TaxID=4863 RepID=A0A9W8KXG2_9FUNG|nr:TLD-domain-containing protein [Coemansia spiralis]KAJ1995329.1 hypothetical protein EDC05_000880 [Coemansia umbellata]KAJ2624844.1 hypothetical protein GGI26_001261 [Coemansia sp. RSA 1358]KAJ2674356.1 hypothetical protein GGI25_004376 [Coemansia spiralis]
MGNIESSILSVTRSQGKAADSVKQLSAHDKQVLEAYKHTHELNSANPFGSGYLYPYLKDLSNLSAQERLALLLYGDEYAQADAVYKLARLDTVEPTHSLREFATCVCKQAMARYWQHPEIYTESWFVDWILTRPQNSLVCMYATTLNNEGTQDTFSVLDEENRDMTDMHLKKWLKATSTPGGITQKAWQQWWKESTVFREFVDIALRTTELITQITKERDATNRKIINRVAENNLHSPQMLKPDIEYIFGIGNQKPQALLSPCIAWVICQELPSDSRIKWECVYSSKRDGRSWSTFQNAIENRGSVLLLVREKHANDNSPREFGAYLDSELTRKPTWHGTSDNLLFTIDPNSTTVFTIFRTTGFNDHYQYFNYATKTLPNGLGVGGQMGHFGLWIDSDFMHGCSNTAATFESKQLSTRAEFDIDTIEVWLVKPSKHLDEIDGSDKTKKSAMDANPDAVALLEMANRTMYSKMVREPEKDSS